MSNNEKIKLMFASLQTKLQADLNLSQVHDNNTARGDNSEVSWRDMLSKHLPARYKVGTGFVIDSDVNQSDAVDIIIYDNHYSPYVFNENEVLYVPAESVYAVIECKQKLDKGHIEYAAQKAASVRALKRTSLPVRQINGDMVAKVDSGIIVGLVTTSSDWNPPFGEPFRAAIQEAADTSHLDFGCSLADGSFTINYGDELEAQVSISEDSLVTFFINLVTDLQAMGNAPALDLKAYYNAKSEC
jgi:hypothetical protein